MSKILCTHVHGNGRRCRGCIVKVEALGADLAWRLGQDFWSLDIGQPKKYRLHCSTDNHTALQVAYRDLPQALQTLADISDLGIDLDDHVEVAA